MVAETVGALISSSCPPEGYELMSNNGYMGLEIVDVLMGRYMKSNIEHTTRLLDTFTQQKPINNLKELSSRMAEWRTLRQRCALHA